MSTIVPAGKRGNKDGKQKSKKSKSKTTATNAEYALRVKLAG